MFPSVRLLLLVAGVIICFTVTIVALNDLGFAFMQPCTATGAVKQGYTGCFSWTQWWESVLIILVCFAFFAFTSAATRSVAQVVSSSRCCDKASGWFSWLVLFAVNVFAAYGSMYYLAKPLQTYQTDASGITISNASEWTIDQWQVFLGGGIFAAAAPLSVALLGVAINLCRSTCNDDDRADIRVVEATADQELTNLGGGIETSLLNKNSNFKFRVPKFPFGRVLSALLVLGVCYVATTVGSPLWNYSANSYFMSRSTYAWGNLSIGGPRPCSLNKTCDCGSGFDYCPWFSFHAYTDTFVYYAFLAVCVVVAAAAHNLRCCACARRTVGGPAAPVTCPCLPRKMRCFMDGCSVLEAVAIGGCGALYAFWFIYWYFLYDRFTTSDTAHDCWSSEAESLFDGDGATCNSIPGNVVTNLGPLHVMARVMGHMASLSFALTALPVAKGSILLGAAGVSWEAVLHWHRGLGAVAFFAVTIHMLLWWIKWGIEGSLTANIFFNISTDMWLWVTPTWQHYENWSVLMAQIAWVFFFAMLIIAWTCRRTMYRLFYLSHHIGVIFLMFGLVHAWSFWYFAAPGLILWWVDRMRRLVSAARILHVESGHSLNTTTDACYSILEVRAPHIAKSFVPGQFALINVGKVASSEWHPFTINTSITQPRDNIVLCIKAGGPWTRRLHQLVQEENRSLQYNDGLDDQVDDPRTRLGPVLVAGVYGGVAPYRYCDAILNILVAGGIGITPVISVFRTAVAARMANDPKMRGPDGVTLVWAIRSLKLLELPVVSETITAARTLPSDCGISFRIHWTGQKHDLLNNKDSDTEQGEASSENEDTSISCLPPNAGVVTFHQGRPDIERIFADQPAGHGGFAFACGPTPLQEATVRNALRFGFSDVHTETFEF